MKKTYMECDDGGGQKAYRAIKGKRELVRTQKSKGNLTKGMGKISANQNHERGLEVIYMMPM